MNVHSKAERSFTYERGLPQTMCVIVCGWLQSFADVNKTKIPMALTLLPLAGTFSDSIFHTLSDKC